MTIETESPPPTAAPEAGPGQGPELERVMSLLEHLDELRSTLVRVAIVAVLVPSYVLLLAVMLGVTVIAVMSAVVVAVVADRM